MSTTSQISGPQRLRFALKRRLPLVVWVLVLGVVIGLYRYDGGSLDLRGYAEATRYEVAAAATGRLSHVAVAPGELVKAGQILAVLDDAAPLLELRAARAELRRLDAELYQDQSAWRLDQLTEARRFHGDATDLRIDHLAAQADLAEARVELRGLDLDLMRADSLAAGDLVSQSELDASRVARDALAERVARTEDLVAELAVSRREAEARLSRLRAGLSSGPADSLLLARPHEETLRLQEIRIAQAELAVERACLRAPADGRVDVVSRAPGDVVAAGEMVLSLVAEPAVSVVAWMPEDRALDAEAGDAVRLRRSAAGGRVLQGRVASVGASVELLPDRLAPVPGVPSWGRSLRIALPESLGVVPGEAFELSLSD